MNNTHQTIEIEIPSGRRLLRSVLLAIATAITILLTIVWPAEYGFDPTGVGRLLGLTQMGESKIQAAKFAMQDSSDILYKAAQIKALDDILKRLNAIEAKLPGAKSQNDDN